ncbi:MAG: HAMP domain-containing sensor histidine kinase [Tissierellia bacterium]|nr:HAMP domain-containing sensor histidine kinase [Tissierellia bacterium]MDD3227505.1 HAMP domain-containing sensor histidine kinase [Tissierellia bacterium]MDD4045775.1 HAMP domain-containing sensor histidine kinase [Tissierellia bacterium]MDD4678670.1 HAMP domain-containing sensor histidine kinase [Tissierellia bacterium]
MKNKISIKLTVYFSAALIVFSIIIGSIFMLLFKNNAIEIYKNDLEKRALTIADTISELMDDTKLNFGPGMGMRGGMMGLQGGLGSYIRNLDDIAMADAWIVDEELNLLITGTMSHMQYNYADLPQDADIVVKNVFKGETTFSEVFSRLLESPALTVGTPITANDEIIGALLIHSPVEGMNDAIKEGFRILFISILTALILSVFLSVALALTFTRPLNKMKNTAALLALGNYNVKTEIKQNDEIGDLAETMDMLSQRLSEADEERNRDQKQRQDFITNISHELRTPVTVIRGSLEALCDEVVTEPDQVKEYHKQMLNESKSLERLVNDLLELSRLQNTDFKIEMQELNICDVLKDSVRSASNLARKKNINIEYSFDRDVFLTKGDYGRLRQMFLTVIDNSVKFSYENSSINIIMNNNRIIIKDKGIGISDEDLPKIFDRYFSVKSDENKTGTGLGLTIAKQIALRHNIELFAESQLNEGTSFVFVVR